MKRIPEPEVMDGLAQSLAYARADFSAVNGRFVADLLAEFPDVRAARAVDLGCGPADIPLRLADAAPGARVLAVDASLAMLRLARDAITGRRLAHRIALVCARLPYLPLPAASFDAVISNSLLHHLPDPAVLWREARRLGRPGAALFVMDLFRPDSVAEARAIVEAAAGDADPLLKEDFFNSLLAAFSPHEVQAALDRAGLGPLLCRVVSERHWLVSGRL